jgi:hypothetical protein
MMKGSSCLSANDSINRLSRVQPAQKIRWAVSPARLKYYYTPRALAEESMLSPPIPTAKKWRR